MRIEITYSLIPATHKKNRKQNERERVRTKMYETGLGSSKLPTRIPASKDHKYTGTYGDLYQNAQGHFLSLLRTFEVGRVWRTKGPWQARGQGAQGRATKKAKRTRSPQDTAN